MKLLLQAAAAAAAAACSSKQQQVHQELIRAHTAQLCSAAAVAALAVEPAKTATIAAAANFSCMKLLCATPLRHRLDAAPGGRT